LNVLYVAPDVVVPYYRGASTHVLEVARGLAGIGDTVHVLSRRLNRSQPKHESSDGVIIHRIFRGILNPLPGSGYSKVERGESEANGVRRSFYRSYLSTLFPLYAGLVSLDLIRRHKIQVVLERETAFGAGAFASVRSGVPLVLEVVGPRYSEQSMAAAKTVLAYTRTMVRGADSAKVTIVDAGVDLEKFRPDQQEGKRVRTRLGLGGGELLVGYVGTFQPWHGLDSLMVAAGALARESPKLRLLLVGPYSGTIRETSRSLGLEGMCLFTGPVPYDEVPGYVNACDVMVAPYDPRRSTLRASKGIGSPLKVLEYMACAKPVVTTDLEPTNRIRDISKAAFLIPPGDSVALADSLRTLLQDRGRAELMGLAGRTLVERGYSWREFATRLHGILQDAVTGRAS
jgi:glycosyltransferase involved in cell wall biosynthesis